jgi:hypothetical protein
MRKTPGLAPGTRQAGEKLQYLGHPAQVRKVERNETIADNGGAPLHVVRLVVRREQRLEGRRKSPSKRLASVCKELSETEQQPTQRKQPTNEETNQVGVRIPSNL